MITLGRISDFQTEEFRVSVTLTGYGDSHGLGCVCVCV